MKNQSLQGQAAQLNADIRTARQVIQEHEKVASTRNKIVEKTLKLEGQIWTQDVLSATASSPFRRGRSPLSLS